MRMAKNQWLDFKQIKERVGMENLLQHYGILEKMKRKGDQLTGFCPLPGHSGKGKNSPSFSVNTAKNAWQCFSCDKGGNTFDFVMVMESLTEIREAAKQISEWFGNVGVVEKPERESNTQPASSPAPQEEKPVEPSPRASKEEKEEQGINPPLTFILKNLNDKHPYLKQRNLEPNTIEHFGVGFCNKGLMKDRIVIPIHNQQNELVAYAGRAITEEDEVDGKYKFPPNFHKRLELFNLNQALIEGDGQSLILVEGFFDVMRLWQCGYQNTVALMGSSFSKEQEEMVITALHPQGHVTLFFDGDPAGQACIQEVLARLAPHLFVKIIWLKEGQQPDSISDHKLREILG